MKISITPFHFSKLFTLFVLFVLLLSCNSEKMDLTVSSPDQNIKIQLKVGDEGQVSYAITSGNDTVIDYSELGVVMENEDFSKGLKLISVSGINAIEESYELLHGKSIHNVYKANEKIYHLANANGAKMDVIFRVSDDGVGFRYYFPEKSEEVKFITRENTFFNFDEETHVWLQPMSEAKTGWESSNPSYEEHYIMNAPIDTVSPLGAGWVYPGLFNTGDHWVLITETGLHKDYCGTRLETVPGKHAMKVAFPDSREVFTGGEVLPNAKLPMYTPWRVITIGSLETIVESTLGTDLADPAIEGDFSFVEPGYASWSWVLLKDDFTVYDVQKEFVDYAAEMNWKYCLVDADWDRKIGYEKIAELSEYAQSKGVGLILWYNSAGDWNTTPYTPRNKLLTHEGRVEEFSKLQKMGIKGIKVDFFGGDGQSMIAYYIDLFKDAADYDIMVNCHGATLPRGWHRTYPNLVTMESIKGMEFITFDQRNADLAASHSAMLPFTRNAFDPMDFTPMALYEIPNIERKTTSAFELATSILFLSGIQHMAETPEGMSQMPDFVKEFLRNLPVKWDETQFITGFPGKEVVLARRHGNEWYVVGINGEEVEKDMSLDLSFINSKSGVLITDGEEPKTFIKEDIQISDTVNIKVKPNGGFVIKIG